MNEPPRFIRWSELPAITHFVALLAGGTIVVMAGWIVFALESISADIRVEQAASRELKREVSALQVQAAINSYKLGAVEHRLPPGFQYKQYP